MTLWEQMKEVCAKVCDEHAAFFRSDHDGSSTAASVCADAIRKLPLPAELSTEQQDNVHSVSVSQCSREDVVTTDAAADAEIALVEVTAYYDRLINAIDPVTLAQDGPEADFVMRVCDYEILRKAVNAPQPQGDSHEIPTE